MTRALLLASIFAASAVCASAQDGAASTPQWEDKTSLISDPSFENATAVANLKDKSDNAYPFSAPTGWTLAEGSNHTNAQAGVANASSTIQGIGSTFAPKSGNGNNYMYIRYNWDQTGTYGISQTLANLPAGMYRLSCDVATYSSNSDKTVYTLSATQGGSDLASSHATYSTAWHDWQVAFTVETAGDVTIQANMVAGAQGGGQNYSMLLDNFQLQYMSAEDYATLQRIEDEALQKEDEALKLSIFGEDYSATKRYNVIMRSANTGDHTVNGKALTQSYRSQGEGGYNLQWTDEAGQTPHGQSFYFTKVDGSYFTYTMSFTDDKGATHYVCTGVHYGGNTSQIRTTTTAADALKIKMEKSGDYVHFLNTEANNIIGGQDKGFYTASLYKDLEIAAAEQYAEPVEIGAGKYATRIFPFTPTGLEGVTFYSCASVNGSTLVLTEETNPQADVPYILYSENGVNTTLSDYASARDKAYTAGLLTGVYDRAYIENNTSHDVNVPQNSYVLQSPDGVQKFVQVPVANFQVTPCRAYLTLPTQSNVKAFGFSADEATAIQTVSAEKADAETYDLQGRRVAHPVRGLYIIGGRKVMIR